MKVLIQRELILQVVGRWKAQYPIDYQFGTGRSSDAILSELKNLDLSTCSASEVDRIIECGSERCSGWVSFNCNECNSYKDWVVQVGDEPDYDSATVQLCRECLQKAVDLLK